MEDVVGARLIVAHMPEELVRRLARCARATGKSRAHLMREALEMYLEDLEDVAEARQAHARVMRGEARTIPLEEVEKALGLED